MGDEVGIVGSFVTAMFAIFIASWFSSVCAKRNYSSNRSFLYGAVLGIGISSITIAAATVLGESNIPNYGLQNLIKDLVIVSICGIGLGIYCWDEAVKEHRE